MSDFPQAPQRRARIVSAAALFDGHDAAINVVRRLLQQQGAELIHLGHDRSVEELVEAAIEEDADAIAVSSYQGGHLEFFGYLLERLRALGASDVLVFGGGGGTITPDEVSRLEALGVARIFRPEDGRSLGLEGMAREIVDRCLQRGRSAPADLAARTASGEAAAIARAITLTTSPDVRETAAEALRAQLPELRRRAPAPVVGFTGTGGAGKSSVVDELLLRFLADPQRLRIGVLLIDPTRQRSGGALLGDRLRFNSIGGPRSYVRSLATRAAAQGLAPGIAEAIAVLQAADFDLILLETAGIGQGDSALVAHVDLPVYVMTPEFGAPSQLEKIDMLDFAEIVVLNKADRRGAADALREVRKQWRRNHRDFRGDDADTPVFATVASRWNDAGIGALHAHLARRLFGVDAALLATAGPSPAPMIPASRTRYLAEIAEGIRAWHRQTAALEQQTGRLQALERCAAELEHGNDGDGPLRERLAARANAQRSALPSDLVAELESFPALRASYRAAAQDTGRSGPAQHIDNYFETLAGTRIPKIGLPRSAAWPELVRYLRSENLPGRFPFTAGVFAFRSEGEEPTRMFAGEGTPERTNRRFHRIHGGRGPARLSTAFDSVTLYGRDPDERPDIFGKVGNSGVSVCTLDDVKKLYSGFDLNAPSTSVSMTINGPAPILLACFFHAAIDQAVERYLRASGALDAQRQRFAADDLPRYDGPLPEGHSGLGLGLLGIDGARAVEPEVYARIRAETLRTLRGTLQADILKEEQAQNTCIFSTDFSLRAMADVEEWFVAQGMRNFYSVSISGYHIAEAGANPITQLAFTLANGFTYCEAYLARGMAIDAFAPHFSFFFSNGLDAEYNVLGRVARRIWSIALREVYGASERSQKLKYHVQTSGRSLHAQEMAYNDIRTTLQALSALQDACNSLHTNAYDEAVTTPTEESLRRALAIQRIIQRELGQARSQNPLQGSYWIEDLTDRVEEAVLQEFERLAERGGVLGAMEHHYQRSRIQEESLHYESLKHSGALEIVGVNCYEAPETETPPTPRELTRSSDREKRQQVENLRRFQARHADQAPRALAELQRVARSGGNVFEALLDCVTVASLGQISAALFEVGGRYRRSM